MTTLILSRKLGESIMIGDGITVTPVRRSGQVIKLRINAPRDVPIRRGELEPLTTKKVIGTPHQMTGVNTHEKNASR